MCLPFPNRFYQRVQDIGVPDLEAMGVSGVLLDIDGTLTPETADDIVESVFQWMDGLKKAGVRLFFLSNSRRPERVRRFAQRAGSDWIHLARKPLRVGFIEASRRLGLPPEKLAVVGDQIFTDMLGARLCGMKGILVESLDRDLWYFYPRRLAELPFRREKK